MDVRYLSHVDTYALLDIISDSHACTTLDDLVALMARLDTLLPYSASLACLTRFAPDATVESFEVINVDYPVKLLETYAEYGLVMQDPVIEEYFRNDGLQYWGDTLQKNPATKAHKRILDLCDDFGFARARDGVGYAHGIRDTRRDMGSFFCYHGLEQSDRTNEILERIVPHYHTAMQRITGAPSKSVSLTPREIEVLKWIARGKSSWEASVILSVSERTVKFHLANITRKLDAANRTHAVAIAMKHGLITLD